MSTILDHMAPGTPDIGDASLTVPAENERIERRIALAIAEPGIVRVDADQVAQHSGCNGTRSPATRLSATAHRMIEQHPPS